MGHSGQPDGTEIARTSSSYGPVSAALEVLKQRAARIRQVERLMTASGASAEALRAERRRVDLARKFLGQAQRIVDAELTGLGIIYTADGLSITRFTTPSGSLEFAIPID